MDLDLALTEYVAGLRDGRSAKLPDDPTDLGQRARVFTAPGLLAQPFWPVPAAVRELAADALCDIRRELLQLLGARKPPAQRHGRNVYEPYKVVNDAGQATGGVVFDPNDGWRSVDFLQDGRWNTVSSLPLPLSPLTLSLSL